MKTKRKLVLKWLRKVTQSLPPETYKAYHKYFEPRMEEDENGEKVLRMGYLQDHPVSHKRRCKYLYDTYGFEAVQAYFLQRGFQFSEQA